MIELMEASRKNILVIGESGGGKRSVIEMLLSSKTIPKSALTTTTFFSTQHPDPQDSLTYHKINGLDHSHIQNIPISPTEATTQLIRLLKSLQDGISLLIFVMRKGRIKLQTEDNYKLFVDTICLQKVPVILLLTHCDLDQDMDAWWTEQKPNFDKYNLNFVNVVCGCFSRGQGELEDVQLLMKKRYRDTRDKLGQSIRANVLSTEWKMDSLEEWFEAVFPQVFEMMSKRLRWRKGLGQRELVKILGKEGIDCFKGREMVKVEDVWGSARVSWARKHRHKLFCGGLCLVVLVLLGIMWWLIKMGIEGKYNNTVVNKYEVKGRN